MALSNTTVSQTYACNGAVTTFAIPFDFVHWDNPYNQIKVYLLDPVAETETLLTRTTDYVHDPDDTEIPPTSIVTVLTYAAPKQIRVERQTDIKQILSFLNSNTIYTETSERQVLDRTVMIAQELAAQVGRALKISNFDVGVTDPELPPFVEDSFLAVASDGTTLKWVSIAAATGGGVLTAPTDGIFGGPGSGTTGTAGSITGVDIGDSVSDAFDKVELIFEKLAPAKPPNLSAITMTIAGSYPSLESGTGTACPVTIDSTTPTLVAGAFGDGAQGTLNANLDAVDQAQKTLSTASDVATVVGTSANLQILTDVDYYLGQAGKEGFWFVLTAQMVITAAQALGTHIGRLIHSVTGVSTLTFAVDDPGTVTIANKTLTHASGTTIYISGVPSEPVGAVVTCAFRVGNAIRSHYNSSQVARSSGTEVSTINSSPGATPNSGDNYDASHANVILTGKYNENITVTCTGFNSKGGTTASGVQGNIRVDTLSSESARFKSGTGQYPTKGTGGTQFGDTWVATTLLSANKELQMLGGLYQYPPLVSYTSNLPTAGPDYTGLTTDSYASMRWVTFKHSTISSATSVTINLTGTQNFGSTALISGLAMYVLVDGGTPTAGWVDANAAYPGVGNPTNSGDAALDVGSSTVTSRRVTFGASVKTGDVWVRIGIPSGSTKKFTGVS